MSHIKIGISLNIQQLAPEKLVPNSMSDAPETGTGFAVPVLAPISVKCVMGIMQ